VMAAAELRPLCLHDALPILAAGDHLDCSLAEDVCARIGEVKVRVVAREDPGVLLTHVAEPEHSDDRGCGHVFEEHLHHAPAALGDRKSTRLNSSHVSISYAV